MIDPKDPARGVAGVPGGDAWFISLGDLLTLLVCFFLLLTPQEQSTASVFQTNQMVSQHGRVSMDFGTDLAAYPLDSGSPVTKVVPIWRELLGSAGNLDIKLGGQVQWALELSRALERGESAVVKLCERSVEQVVVAEVVTELTRHADSIRRVQFEVGSECSQLKERLGSPAELAAVVIFSRK